MEKKKKGTLDFTQIFPEMGLQFTGTTDEFGKPIVVDKETGQEGSYDINAVSQEILSSVNEGREEGDRIQSLDELDIQFNTPAEATNISPASITQRFKLKAGTYTTSGLINKLKKEYQDVQYNEDKGIVVKENGVWKSFDPGLFQTLSTGDAWEISKEIGKDLAEFVPGFATRAGAAAGGFKAGALAGAPLGPVGSIAGGLVGAGVAAGTVAALDTTVGKLQGTYDATPGEQLADVALETALTMGGYAVPLGVKPAKDLFVQAMRKIGMKASRGPIAQLLGATVQKPPQMIERVLEKPELINRMIDTTKGMNFQAADDLLSKRAGTQVIKTLSDVRKGLNKEFGKREAEFLSELGENFSADIVPAVQSTMLQLQQKTGVGLVKAVSTDASKKGALNAINYQPVSFKEFQQLMGPNLPGISLNKAYKGLQELVRQGNAAIKTGSKATGKDILKFRRQLDDFVYNSRIMADENVDQFLAPIARSYRNDLVNTFQSANPRAYNMYKQMNEFYESGLEDAVSAGKILNGPRFEVDKKAQTFVNSLLSRETSRPQREFLERASELAYGSKLMSDRVMDSAAAKAFLPFVERSGFLIGAASIGTGALIGGSVANVPGLAIGTGVGIALSSPRVFARGARYLAPNQAKATMPYAKILMKSIKGMSQDAREQLLVSPAALSQMLNITAAAPEAEDQEAINLLQQVGAVE